MKHHRRHKIAPEIQAFIEVRREARISQALMAKRAGVCATTVMKFERGDRIGPMTEKPIRAAYEQISALGDIRGAGGEIDATWLRRQTESFLKTQSLGFCEKDRLAYFVISAEKFYEYGRLVLLAAGKNID